MVGIAITLAALPLGAIRTEDATVTDLTAPAILFTATWALGRSMRSRRAPSRGSRTAPTG